jgi:hypothetical protein
MSDGMLNPVEPSAGDAPALNSAPLKPSYDPDRWKTLVLLLTMINTILVAIIAGLQTDANIRGNTANRDSQYYAILTSAELQRAGLQSNYDMNTYAKVLDNTQRSLLMQFTALQQTQNNDNQGAELSTLQGQVAQAQADMASKFSVFYRDPRYAPKNSGDAPNLQSYVKDTSATAQELLVKQNTAADLYNKWSGKADAYVAVLTILAIAFFLLGIAQSVNPRLRLLFAVFGIAIIVLGVGWALVILIG